MVVTDLTEQKRNEAILAAEKLSNAILEQAADAIVICDRPDGSCAPANRHKRSMARARSGNYLNRLFPCASWMALHFLLSSTIDTNHSQSVEARLEYDGQECNLLVSVGH